MTEISGTYEIESIGDGRAGRHYDLTDEAPIDGITVNELDGEITIHDKLNSEE